MINLKLGEVHDQEVLESHDDVSVVPMFSSKYKVSEIAFWCILTSIDMLQPEFYLRVKS